MTRSEGEGFDETSLNVSTAEGNGWSVVSVSGEIDISTATEFDDTLKAAMASSQRVVVDLSGVRFMDSTGLGVLMRAQKQRGDDAAAGLRLAAPPARVERLLNVTKLDTVFAVYPSVAAALGEPLP